MAKNKSKNKLTVIDFFCGAGGFSEGFRQQGYEIILGVDFWQPAISTYNHNFNKEFQTKNVLDFYDSIEEIEKLPNSDVIIGSPPCVSFSSSNKSGKADKEYGLKLTESFLRIIAVKKHQPKSKLKAWFMENVENSKKYLKESYSFSDLNLTSWVFNKNEKEVKQRVEAYSEILNLFKDYEFESILYSIYFDSLSDQLFDALSKQIRESVPHSFKDNFQLLKLLNNETPSLNNSRINGYLNNIFTQYLVLGKGDWEREDSKRNEIVTKLNVWLENKLKEEGSENEIQFMLFHYTKVWNMFFSNPYNDIKGIILLNGMSSSLKRSSNNLKVNINSIIMGLSAKLNTLYCSISPSPFLETLDVANSRKPVALPGYIKQLSGFNDVKRESNQFLLDFEKMSFQNLIKLYFESKEDVQKKLSEAIFQKMVNGKFPNPEDLKYFASEIGTHDSGESNDSQNFITSFAKRNYLF
jgi:predicted RNA methylase